MGSLIKTVELKNFMAYKEGIISFDEKNIICLKGYNDIGKSAAILALRVAFTDCFKNKQVSYIRNGEDFFRVVVTFDDGVILKREKYLTGQSLYEMYKDDKCIFSTKQGNKLTRISGVPEPIEKYLDLIKFNDKEVLNFQDSDSPMMLVETTGSENYGVLHTVLKTEELTRAGNVARLDKNETNAMYNDLNVDFEKANMEVAMMRDVSTDLIDMLENKDAELDLLQNRVNHLSSITNIIENLTTIKNIPILESISTKKASKLSVINSLLVNIHKSGEKQIPDMSDLDSRKSEMLQNILLTASKIKSSESSDRNIPNLERVEIKGMNMLKSIHGVIQCIENVSKYNADLKGTIQELESVKSELDKVAVKVTESGQKIVRCDNCGTITVA